jgi:hypothetical protein
MAVLDKLKLSDKVPSAAQKTPEGRLRSKLADAINLQIAAAQAMVNGETFIRRAKRWVDDPETGKRVAKDLPVRFRPWYFQDETGALMLEVRYANRRIEIKPKKPAIEVGEIENLVPTLTLIRDGVLAGELDKQLKEIKQQRRFKKAS